jgi:hypothetical protein
LSRVAKWRCEMKILVVIAAVVTASTLLIPTISLAAPLL